MRIFILVALAIALFAHGTAQAQTASLPNPNSSTISNSTADVPDDETFAHFDRVTAGVTPPKATHSPDPKFPDLAADTEPRGIVVMLIGINTKGHVEAVHVLRSSTPAFESSAVTTVRKWRFKPAEKNGKPVPVQVTVEMKFQK